MSELQLLSLLQGIEEKLEKNNELLVDAIKELKQIKSEASSINGNTDYTYNVKNTAEEILEFLKKD